MRVASWYAISLIRNSCEQAVPLAFDAQGERYSFAHFVYPRHGAIIQGPKKTYPAVTFEQFMVKKSEGFAYTLPKDPKVRRRDRHLSIKRCMHACMFIDSITGGCLQVGA